MPRDWSWVCVTSISDPVLILFFANLILAGLDPCRELSENRLSIKSAMTSAYRRHSSLNLLISTLWNTTHPSTAVRKIYWISCKVFSMKKRTRVYCVFANHVKTTQHVPTMVNFQIIAANALKTSAERTVKKRLYRIVSIDEVLSSEV